ncbi:DUF3127 domain-containing protein [Vicingaceae bacterium]|nr:DUF3127 domain-containing protein [Vicingaceae bacterium]
MEIKGRITKKLAVESGMSKAGKSWQKQSFVIDTGAQYNPEVCFQTFGDKCEMLNRFDEGQEVSVAFNISSREYNGKYYHNIDAWKIEPLGERQPQEEKLEAADLGSSDNDGLPF